MTKEIIVALLKSRLYSHEDIAKMHHISRSRVTQIASEAGLSASHKQNTLTKETWSQLLSEYPYQTVTYLANKYNISRAAIYQQIRKHT